MMTCTRYQGGNEDLLDIGKEGDPIHRRQEHRRGQASRVCGGEGSCLPMSMWDRGKALATLRAAPQTGHLGRGAGLIDEHQSAGIEIGLAFEPGQPARGDVRALLLGGVRGFF